MEITDKTMKLADKFIDFGVLKKKSYDDCQHIAAAIVSDCDIIISWNFKPVQDIGLLMFSKAGLDYIVKVMEDAHRDFEGKPWQQSGKEVKKAYMTDLLDAVIESGRDVKVVRFEHGWIEFDTNEDYETAIKWAEEGDSSMLTAYILCDDKAYCSNHWHRFFPYRVVSTSPDIP